MSTIKKLRQGNVFTPVCDSVHKGVSVQGGVSVGGVSVRRSLSRGSLSRRVSVQGSRSLSRSLSRGVSVPVQGVSVQGGLCTCPGGLCPGGSLSGGSLSWGLSQADICVGVSVQSRGGGSLSSGGGLCLGEGISVQGRGVFVWGSLSGRYLSGGLCPGGGDLCPGERVSVQGKGSLSRGGGLYPGQGRGVSVYGRGSLSRGGVSLSQSMGVYVRETPPPSRSLFERRLKPAERCFPSAEKKTVNERADKTTPTLTLNAGKAST